MKSELKPEYFLKEFKDSYFSKLIVKYEDKKPVIVRVNRKFKDYYGYNKKDVIGKNPKILRSGEQGKKFYKKMWKDLLNPRKKGWKGEIINKKKNGEKITVYLAITTIFEDKKPVYFIASHLDLTHHKKVEKELRNSNEKLRYLYDNSLEFLIKFDLKGKIVDLNKSAKKELRRLKINPKKVIGKHVKNVIDLKDVPKVLKAIALDIAGKKSPVLKAKLKIDGKEAMLEFSEGAIPLRDERGKLIGFQVSARNVTKRYHAQKALKKSEEKLRYLFNNSNDLIQSCNLKGEIIEVNKAWMQVMGYKKKELQNLKLFSFIAPESKKHCKKLFKRVIKGESLHNINAVLLTKNGKKVYVEGEAFGIKKDGKITGTWSIFKNVTLKNSLNKLKETIKLRNLFLMRVSQELKHPLVPIVGYSSVMLDENPSKIQKKYLEKILLNSNKLKDLVNKVIGVTSYETGEFKLNIKKTNVGKLTKKIVNGYKEQIKLKNLKLKTKIKDFKAEIDIQKYTQLLEILIDNAVKFTKKGHVSVLLREKEEFFELEVEDTGKGMSEEKIEQLLAGNYSSESKEEVNLYKELNLGILLCQLIIKSHNGRLRIESEEKKKTKFIVIIPKRHEML